MLNPYLGNLNKVPQEKYNAYRQAAERTLLGWPQDGMDSDRLKDPKKASPIESVLPPSAPIVANRTMPGTTPMKVKG